VSKNEVDQLRHLLQARQTALVQSALNSGGKVDARELEACERLKKVYELTRGRQDWSRSVQVLVAGLVALCVMTLLLVPLPVAEVELHAETTGVRFVLGAGISPWAPVPVKWLTVQGHSMFHVLPSDDQPAIKIQTPIVKIENAKPAGLPAILMILPSLPADVHVEVVHHREDGSREIALCGIAEPVRLTFAAPVRLTGDSVVLLRVSRSLTALAVPRSDTETRAIRLVNAPCSQEEMLRFRFVSAEPDDIHLTGNLPVRDVETFVMRRTADGFPEPVSTLVSGSLRVLSVKAGPSMLHRNDIVVMKSSSGRMRSFMLGREMTKFDFHGTVKSLTVGSVTARRSVMPRLFEWWLSQELIVVAWSAGLSVLGLIMGVYQWLTHKG
jgi:hypothetical protein